MKKYNDDEILSEEDLENLEIKCICPKCGALMRKFALNEEYWICENCDFEYDEQDVEVI